MSHVFKYARDWNLRWELSLYFLGVYFKSFFGCLMLLCNDASFVEGTPSVRIAPVEKQPLNMDSHDSVIYYRHNSKNTEAGLISLADCFIPKL